jgi:hypothetical protein
MGCDMVGAPSAPPNSHWTQQQQMGERGRPCRHSLSTYCQPLRLASSHFVEFTPPTQPPSTPSPPWPLYKVGLGHQTDQHWQSTRHRVSTSLISIVSPESENQFLIELKSE